MEDSWLQVLHGELKKPYAQSLCKFVENEIRGSTPIYPPPQLIFNALHSTPFDHVKAVIIGQVIFILFKPWIIEFPDLAFELGALLQY